ncbi:MucR family transcriptional regulator [Desulfohalobiaceae bacterium Ax17]|uniref:MucR family transcriptional regulator n=1 Tax=Desulfovulcanus ferrireducens TaxID=2831190 RepID=UPI00207BBD15|nr:MucR family transcriptional regulator [Desulfovulcanus ferrireducens]MBT8763915.1 MucR family transcriptional regulator [Desulfovulcanus ferrireducens]
MEDSLKQALEIVKAQAGVRVMSAEEMVSMIGAIAESISKVGKAEIKEEKPPVDPQKAIREKSVICLECGKAFKVLTKKHLASHDLTPEEYKEKWGYKKGISLVAKSLARERRKKMQSMKLWEKRKMSKGLA